MTDTDLHEDHEARIRALLQAEAALVGDPDARAIVALAAVQARHDDPIEPPTIRYRSTRLIATAAALVIAVAAAIGFVVTRSDSNDIRVVPPPPDTTVHYVPAVWPPEADGPIEARNIPAKDRSQAEPAWIVARDRRAVASTSVGNFPLTPVTGFPPGEANNVTVRDHPAVLRTNGGTTDLWVGLLPGRTLYLHSATLDRDGLEKLAEVFDMTTGHPNDRSVPTGWSITPDTYGLASAAIGGTINASSSVQRTSSDSTTGLQVMLRQASVPDAQAAFATIAELQGRSPDHLPVIAGHRAVTVPMADSPDDRGIVWVLDSHTIGQLFSNVLALDDLNSTFESVRPVSAGEWQALVPPTAGPELRTVDGFRLLPDATIVDTGRTGAYRWMVTLDPRSSVLSEPTASLPPEPEQWVFLHVLGADGTEDTGFGTSPDNGGPSFGGFARGTDTIILYGFVPSGFHLESLTVHDEPVEPTTVPIPNTGTSLMFVILDAATTPAIGNDSSRLTGTRPDGTPFDSTRPTGG